MTDQPPQSSSDVQNCSTWLPPLKQSRVLNLLNGPVTIIIVCVGLILNLVAVKILMKMGSRSGVHEYLIALAFWDSVLLLGSFFLYGLPTVAFGRLPSMGPYVFSYQLVYFVATASLFATVWLVAALMFDRCCTVLGSAGFRTSIKRVKKAYGTGRYIIGAISAFAVIASLPYCFELKVEWCVDLRNKWMPMIASTPLKKNNKLYLLLYHTIGTFLFQTALPVSSVAVMLTLITKSLYQAAKIRVVTTNISIATRSGEHGNGNRRPQSYNKLLYCITAKFLLTRLLPFVLDVTEYCVGQPAFVRLEIVEILVPISNTLVTMNSASNFLLYWAIGSRFRQGMKAWLAGGPFGRMFKLTHWRNTTVYSAFFATVIPHSSDSSFEMRAQSTDNNEESQSISVF